jgi:hypothetical protein
MNRKTRNGGLFEAVASPADRKQHCHKRLRPEVLEMAPSLLGKWRQENQEQLYAALHPAIGPTQVETVIDGVGLSDAVRRLLYANTVETGRRVRGRPPKEEPPQKVLFFLTFESL